ncbi:NAD(P)/FAD-dependent oxidoreductase [Hydrogenophaga sp.]|uniref:NAD(P)/FAD-dependent oxidoreductase n=1 Tax=Hydrogenophaga sp. TaxID=1904254 RepID=UPI0025BB4A26|nr:NAD(P)/FAD-dependent oxidoreductase [Hydrogenophaga sp.]MDO9503751.1 NAD(P)/FAD-dependent oxidoreductase [Hydrogenophaga sp.]MDP2985336.1 NAD(P)/FAD-dependent oxidoreductase [Hydrogenophaga sp.]MDP3628082.1 NAD(P)/FAD-dependent oxidoreductase [Hydrogenophaga sp.]
MAHDGPIEADAVVIGAGPVGLFQVFELGLLEIKAHVIDALPFPGGQPAELYPDKPIYDIPAIPVCTGQELVNNLLKQIEPFGATFHLGQEVTVVEPQNDGRFFVGTTRGTRFLTKTLFIAAGVGAFQPRTLQLDGIEAFHEKQLFYRVSSPNAWAGRNIVIVGGGDTALEWAATLSTQGPNKAASVTLIHRRDAFQAADANIARMRELCERNEMRFLVGQPTGFESGGDRLTAVHITDPQAQTHTVPLDVLLVFLGLSPKLGPIAQWGLDIERKQLVVDTEKFSTNVPGIFAVGDINTYPGKKKLILSGFHEATLAAFGAAPFVFPDKKVMLQYTTTSTQLHRVLGVTPAVSD